MTSSGPDDWLTLRDAAARFGVTVEWLRWKVRSGVLRYSYQARTGVMVVSEASVRTAAGNHDGGRRDG